MNWTQTTPNAAIWTVEQLAYALRIDSDVSSQTEEQDYLNDLQAAAVEFAETLMGCSLINRTITATYFDRNMPALLNYAYGASGRHRLTLPRGPIVSISSVTDAKGLLSSTLYDLEGEGCTDLLKIGVGYVAPLTVVYVAGFGAAASNVPADIRMAIRTHVATLYSQRASAGDRTISAVPHSLEAFYRSKSRTVCVA